MGFDLHGKVLGGGLGAASPHGGNAFELRPQGATFLVLPSGFQAGVFHISSDYYYRFLSKGKTTGGPNFVCKLLMVKEVARWLVWKETRGGVERNTYESPLGHLRAWKETRGKLPRFTGVCG